MDLRERVNGIICFLPPEERKDCVDSIMAAVEQDQAGLFEHLELIEEQLEVNEKSRQFCPSCGWLLPNHHEECGNLGVLLRKVEAERDRLRKALKVIAAMIRSIDGFDPDEACEIIDDALACKEGRHE